MTIVIRRIFYMKFLILLGLSFLLSACAEMATTYHPGGDISGGYGDQNLKPGVHVVFFDGNGFVTQARAKKYFLRRASTITLQSGQHCFKILDLKQTRSENYKTKLTEAVGTKYYYIDDNELIETEANLKDENSYTGVIQMFPDGGDQKDCYNAKNTLQLSKTE